MIIIQFNIMTLQLQNVQELTQYFQRELFFAYIYNLTINFTIFSGLTKIYLKEL